MNKYEAKIKFDSGYVHTIEEAGNFNKNDLSLFFSEAILEGFYPRDKGQVSFGPFHKQITGIEFYLNGIEQKESPTFWENDRGYIFDKKGIKNIVIPNETDKLPDHYTDGKDGQILGDFCNFMTKDMMNKIKGTGLKYTFENGKLVPMKEESFQDKKKNMGLEDLGMKNIYEFEDIKLNRMEKIVAGIGIAFVTATISMMVYNSIKIMTK